MDCPECGEFNSMLAEQCAACGEPLNASAKSSEREEAAEPAVRIRRRRHRRVTKSQRWAGWLIAAQACVNVLWLAAGPEVDPALGSRMYVVATAVDAVIALQLILGNPRFVPFAILREVMGGILWVTIALLGRDYAEVIIISASNGSIAFLLMTNVKLRGRRIAASIAGLTFASSTAMAFVYQFLPRDDAEQTEREPEGGPVVGKAIGYKFQLPPGWVPSEGNGTEDLMFKRSSLDAVLKVEVTTLDNPSPCIDSAASAISGNRTLIEQRLLPKFGDGARLLHVRWNDDGGTSDAWVTLFLTPRRLIAVMGGVPTSHFAELTSDFERIVESFEFPPGMPMLPDNAGPMPHRYRESKLGYSVDFPTGWYREPSTEDGGSADELRAFRPYRCGRVMLESLPASAPFAWRPYEEGLMTAMKGDDRLDLIERRPMGDRTVMLRAEVHGDGTVHDVIAALHRVKRAVVMVRAFAPRPAFTALERELRGIVDSFEARRDVPSTH